MSQLPDSERWQWLDAVPDMDRPGRFARLLHEQLTPGAIRAELRD